MSKEGKRQNGGQMEQRGGAQQPQQQGMISATERVGKKSRGRRGKQKGTQSPTQVAQTQVPAEPQVKTPSESQIQTPSEPVILAEPQASYGPQVVTQQPAPQEPIELEPSKKPEPVKSEPSLSVEEIAQAVALKLGANPSMPTWAEKMLQALAENSEKMSDNIDEDHRVLIDHEYRLRDVEDKLGIEREEPEVKSELELEPEPSPEPAPVLEPEPSPEPAARMLTEPELKAIFASANPEDEAAQADEAEKYRRANWTKPEPEPSPEPAAEVAPEGKPKKVFRYWDVDTKSYWLTFDFWEAKSADDGWEAKWAWVIDGQIDHLMAPWEIRKYRPREK